LLNNAFKFTTKGSIKVIVTRSVNENRIVGKVKDKGSQYSHDESQVNLKKELVDLSLCCLRQRMPLQLSMYDVME
jgi:hypothetical protein